MKIILTTIVVIACTAASYAAPFQNLGFDEANLTNLVPVPNTPPGRGLATDLLPGWQLSLGGNQVTSMLVNYIDQGDGAVIPNAAIVSTNAQGFAFPAEGRFGLYLFDDHSSVANPVSVRYALTQTGDIPFNAKLLSFTFEGWAFDVSINGVKQNTFPGSIFAPDIANVPTVRSVDVSAYAGQTVELKFEGQRDIYFGGYSSHFLDSISFQVPEPSAVTLFVLGGGALLAAGFQRRRV